MGGEPQLPCVPYQERPSSISTPALASRNWVSSGTGRPVEPFSLPDFQAVPAMSRCAQLNFLVKRERNASRYVLMNTEEQNCSPAAAADYSLADRWIQSQLQLTLSLIHI